MSWVCGLASSVLLSLFCPSARSGVLDTPPHSLVRAHRRLLKSCDILNPPEWISMMHSGPGHFTRSRARRNKAAVVLASTCIRHSACSYPQSSTGPLIGRPNCRLRVTT
ncbi:hypothetical protein P691DRAFT_803179 [Macrolepiota fuliginosa MF-IS2]|uniref:Secreted protein n=1 Tax=Macrolepiota fuliginosa MF-IS2 TaxID=1400762 RepID=A0A9P6C060_9AGAR|nr:hypothetical protein P691DRAFT_803179 [Macrolepiota fuliginosa MF-IS2]